MPGPTNTIDAYLSAVNDDQRVALEKIRKTIRTLAPQAEECINYGIAAFRLNGRSLVGFGASATHCSFYPMNGSTVAAFQDELKNYGTSKGCIRFLAAKPLPVSLVRKLVKSRIAEIEGVPGHEKSPKAAAAKRDVKALRGGSRTDPAVAAFWRELDHPLKRDFEAVRKIMLGVSSEIHEGIKWNSVSFRTTEFFATLNLRSRDTVQLIFHKGAKVKDNSTDGMQIADPAGLIKWLDKERCLVTLGVGKDIRARRAEFAAIVREWIRSV